ncbi:TIGR04255 family protein [Jiella sonneratiae]|uniref:TIGR04255 family protein n=1 Tax=Jiella sonneratiae TaxID=2816856 RepID=A0ABS3J2B5_9HYPH|nr:TIGR04255 family protein [Jiella sonneratiae]MBO0903814.1 TIGR04255 family protein [Jiella sonneratiae]
MTNPLRDSAPPEVKLARPPLRRVLAAVYFPAILKISEERGIIGFQDRIRKEYPILQREQQMGMELQVGPTGELLPPQSVINQVWRFLSADSAWRVTLSTEVLALECQTAYVDRDDFLSRLAEVIGIFVDELEPSICNRIGIRYLNVLEAADLDSVKAFVRPGLRSLSDTEVAEQISTSAHSVNFQVPEGTLLTRWGILPPHTVHDPNVMVPEDSRRWYLDLDCSFEAALPFGGDKILGHYRLMTERIYSFFRWAMTPEFIEERKNA